MRTGTCAFRTELHDKPGVGVTGVSVLRGDPSVSMQVRPRKGSQHGTYIHRHSASVFLSGCDPGSHSTADAPDHAGSRHGRDVVTECSDGPIQDEFGSSTVFSAAVVGGGALASDARL